MRTGLSRYSQHTHAFASHHPFFNATPLAPHFLCCESMVAYIGARVKAIMNVIQSYKTAHLKPALVFFFSLYALVSLALPASPPLCFLSPTSPTHSKTQPRCVSPHFKQHHAVDENPLYQTHSFFCFFFSFSFSSRLIDQFQHLSLQEDTIVLKSIPKAQTKLEEAQERYKLSLALARNNQAAKAKQTKALIRRITENSNDTVQNVQA